MPMTSGATQPAVRGLPTLLAWHRFRWVDSRLTFHFYPFVRSGKEGAFTVEELVAELGKNKPSDVVYLIAGSADTRKRTGVDPVGVVD